MENSQQQSKMFALPWEYMFLYLHQNNCTVQLRLLKYAFCKIFQYKQFIKVNQSTTLLSDSLWSFYSKPCINAQFCNITEICPIKSLCAYVCVWGNHSCICKCVSAWYMVISHRRGFYCVIISAVTLTSFGCRSTADQLHQRRGCSLITVRASAGFNLCVWVPATHVNMWLCLSVCLSGILQSSVCTLSSSSLYIYHSCTVWPELSTHLCLWRTNNPPLHVSYCDRFRMRDLWLEANLTNKRLWEDEASEPLRIQWSGYSRQHCQHFLYKKLQKTGGWGKSFDIQYTKPDCVCVCVCEGVLFDAL